MAKGVQITVDLCPYASVSWIYSPHATNYCKSFKNSKHKNYKQEFEFLVLNFLAFWIGMLMKRLTMMQSLRCRLKTASFFLNKVSAFLCVSMTASVMVPVPTPEKRSYSSCELLALLQEVASTKVLYTACLVHKHADLTRCM